MANPNAPFGFKPIRRLDGAAWSGNLTTRKLTDNDGGALNPWRVTPPPVKKVSYERDLEGLNGAQLQAAVIRCSKTKPA
jgi:hypothetical protein